MKRYIVRVTEVYMDDVNVVAENRAEAITKAIERSECVFSHLDDTEVISEEDMEDEQ